MPSKQITLKYDSSRHNEAPQFESIYIGNNEDGIYVLYVNHETKKFVDVVLTIDEEEPFVVYQGKKKKSNLWDNYTRCRFLYFDNLQICLINDENDNCDAIQITNIDTTS